MRSSWSSSGVMPPLATLLFAYEPRDEKTCFLQVRKQRRRWYQDNSDLGQFGPSQFWTLFYSALVNSDLDPCSIRTPTTGQFGPFCNGQFGPHQIFFYGQFGPFSLVNSDLISGQFGPFSLVNSDITSGQFGKFILVSSDLTSCRFHQSS